MKNYLVLSSVGMRKIPRFHVWADNSTAADIAARKLAADIAEALKLHGPVKVETYCLSAANRLCG